MTVVRSLGEEENFGGNAEKDCIYTLRTEGDLQVRSCLPLSPVRDFTAYQGSTSSILDWRVGSIVGAISIGSI